MLQMISRTLSFKNTKNQANDNNENDSKYHILIACILVFVIYENFIIEIITSVVL